MMSTMSDMIMIGTAMSAQMNANSTRGEVQSGEVAGDDSAVDS